MQVAIDAVVGDVGGAVLEPFDRDVVFGERGVLDLGEMFRPVDALGLLGPKPVGIGQRACVHFLVFGLGDEGALGPLGGNFVDLIRHAVLHSVRDRARILSVWRPLSTRLPQPTSGPIVSMAEVSYQFAVAQPAGRALDMHQARRTGEGAHMFSVADQIPGSGTRTYRVF